jgi:hypothetical protein
VLRLRRVSWIQRVAAASAALALASALLAPPPSRAEAGPRGQAAPQEIAAAGPARVGVVPNAPKRGADSPVAARRSFETPALREPAAPRFRTASAGGTPPALERWRLAHSTSTSSP